MKQEGAGVWGHGFMSLLGGRKNFFFFFFFFYFRSDSTGTGCPGRLWDLLLWRYSKPTWMLSHVTTREPALAAE